MAREFYYPLALFLAVVIVGCNDDVPRPDTVVCLNNVAALKQTCYSLSKDYDSNGMLLKTAVPTVIQYADAASMLAALNKNFSTDPAGWASLKAYIRNLRAANQ